jgi:hypothetical protein
MKVRFNKADKDKKAGDEFEIESIDYAIEQPKKTIQSVTIDGIVYTGANVDPVDF